MCRNRLQQRDVRSCSHSGKANVPCSSRDCLAVQPNYKMSDISALRFGDSLGVCRAEWIVGDVRILLHMGDWVDKDTLSVRKG